MRIFVEVTASGEWDDDLQDYEFETVDAPTFFAADQIQWFQKHEDCIIFGVIGYETAFKAPLSVYYDLQGVFGYIRNRHKED